MPNLPSGSRRIALLPGPTLALALTFAPAMALAAGLLASPAAGPGEASPEPLRSETLTSAGRVRKYSLFIPAGGDGSARPLLVLLHGSTRSGATVVRPWMEIAQKEGIVLAGPDSLDSVHWSAPSDGPGFLRDVVEAVGKKTSIDPRRVYLFGHSAGACFSLEMASLESTYFAAVAVHAGALRREDLGAFDWATRKTPYGIWVGTVDPYFPVEWVRENRDALLARGFPVEYAEIPGHDHSYERYSKVSDVNRRMWEFLKTQKLPSDPRYTAYGEER